MADLWYYTSDGQQKEPVTKDELRQLADRGLLKPTDLVWTEGMSKWLRASKVDGVFPDPALARSAFTAGPQGRADAPIPFAAEPLRRARAEDEADDLEARPRRRRERERWEDDEDDFDDDDDERPRRRRRQTKGSGANVALILGSIAGVVLLIGVVIAVIAMVSSGGSGGEGTRSFSLGVDKKSTFNIRFTQGKLVEIWVTSDHNSDVDLFVLDERNGGPIRHHQRGNVVAFDDRDSKDCYVRFVPQSTQTFRIEVWNRHVIGFGAAGRNRPNSGTMRFKESDQPAGAPLKADLPNQPGEFAQPPIFAQPPNAQPPMAQPPVDQPPHIRQGPIVAPIIIPGGAGVGQPPVTRPPVVRPNIPVVRPPAFRPPAFRPPRPGRFR